MKRILKVLIVHSAAELIRYKSFLLLIALLIVAERLFQRYAAVEGPGIALPALRDLERSWAPFLFNELPPLLGRLAGDPRVLLSLAGAFLLKQLISMWPSSDMRRMHRYERERMGFIHSLLRIRGDQVLWDAMTVVSLCLVTGLWLGLVFLVTRALWLATGHVAWLLVCLAAGVQALPIILAGLSYSSKLAVIHRGRFLEKFALFYRLFTDWTVFWQSWALFAIRILIEGLFVAAVPVGVFATIDNYVLRIVLAGLSAAPAYSYVKMASFKFFLELYRKYPLVHEEYRRYYETLPA